MHGVRRKNGEGLWRSVFFFATVVIVVVRYGGQGERRENADRGGGHHKVTSPVVLRKRHQAKNKVPDTPPRKDIYTVVSALVFFFDIFLV